MKKILTTIIIFILLLAVTLSVQAVYISDIGISINLPEEFKYAAQKQEIEDKNAKQYYEENNIYLNATNEEQNKVILVFKLENSITKKINNLDLLEKTDLDILVEQYNKAKQELGQKITKQETVTYNEKRYIHSIYEQEKDNTKIVVDEYYTIVNKKAYVFTQNYKNVEINEEEMKQVINSVAFQEIKAEFSGDFTYTYIIIGLMLILGIGYIIKLKRSKNQIEDKDKNVFVHRIKEYLEKRTNYNKFSGYLVFFIITVILNIVNLSYGSIQYFTGSIFSQTLELKEMIYYGIAILQNIVGVVLMIYIAILLKKREANTIGKISKSLMTILISTIILTLFRVMIQANLYGMKIFEFGYIESEIKVLLQSFVYVILWFLYFKNSIRVAVYYKEKTLEEIILNPNTILQKDMIHKKMMEFKIIDYFIKEKAYDYASGIYINKLPKEYANSVSLSDLNSKKIIRLKRAKYYLSNKDLNNPNAEKRRTLKTALWIIFISILILLLIQTF